MAVWTRGTRCAGRGCGGGVGRSASLIAIQLGYCREGAHLLQSRAQEAADQELEALEFRLDNDELEIRLRIHIPCLVFHKLNLPTPLALPRHT
jgi:hypothetical protein